MAHWAVIIPADTWATERLFHHDTLTVAGSSPARPGAGDDVLLLAGGDEPVLVGLGAVAQESADEVVIAYRRRFFDEPVPAGGLRLDGPVTAVAPDQFSRLATRMGGDPDRRTWLVSVDLPIEASTPAEAVRQFWSYVQELGPAELPAFVSPTEDELAMQAFVLGEEANLDPEEDDED
ncbi:hypothetical protein [Krasilnikovia sp. MM14-A1259]|uniref:hypothetical protein n=1 Tax=Krasilnikovia sp. MM14-A1259 TaxID=3373539 RepID=UPI00399C5F16